MDSPNIPYLVGDGPAVAGPLSRYLPPFPEGVVSAWLEQHLPTGTLVLDPFGASPRLAVEAARAGYPVLVAANNPVMRLLLDVTYHPPSEADLKAALAELAASYRGSERIEPHIRALYTSECSLCGQPVTVECFLWEKQAASPNAKIYHCRGCGDSGERPVSARDQERAAQYAGGGLHRARALERVASKDDPDRVHAEEALSVYLPRAVYALFTLINKLNGLSLSPNRRRCLEALLVLAFDQANTLWQHPVARERPKQLTVPPRFRENNVWLALEAGVEALAQTGENQSGSGSLTYWPELPAATGGICLFEGRWKDLASSLSSVDIGAVVSALPRPNQAFWTLSALWSGWLWGKEAALHLKSVLRRRRYDWGWHMTALSAALAHLNPHLELGTPFFALIGEAEPGFVTAALMAAEEAAFELDGLAVRTDSSQAQVTWRMAGMETRRNPASWEDASEIAQKAAIGFLLDRRQPSAYLPLHTATVSALTRSHALTLSTKTGSPPTDTSLAEQLSQVQALLREMFTFRNGFLRYEGSEQSLDVGQWWLAGAKDLLLNIPDTAPIPFSDQVEMGLVRYLHRNPGCSQASAYQALCTAFPGLYTPDLQLVSHCLESYGMLQEPAELGWKLRGADEPAARKEDLKNGRKMVAELGKRLGFGVRIGDSQPQEPASPITTLVPTTWHDSQGSVRYSFYITASAAIGEIILRSPYPASKCVIVLPGSRSNLVEYKIHTNPFLKQEIDKGWQFLKYRHVRRLLESPTLNAENLDEYLKLDPLTFTDVQMRLL